MIHDLCQKIDERYAVENKPVDLEIRQIKEKWGSLRFYYSYSDNPTFLQAIDSIGGTGIRFYPNGKDEKENAIRHDIAEIVKKQESYSKYVCEICGQPGEIRKYIRHVQTKCDSCHSEYMVKMKESEEKRKIKKDEDK